ncbi:MULTISPECIES: MFS transporter [Brenneria]|uniref:MFS transporter n=1 Tax=Brenneria nigrifluens DSM 30175 = ATCC 13028 TaxID=1121120 RepID=A0A2U1UFC8_9GAMM|nr:MULTISPECIES: MFS transporter [Brenneria]EHD19983.1 major facilitator superfamily MFS_1 [Brenneria sp. EniD312]PWC20376.1 MFS transporter [Brenneria nigrifluens] [Brenneria nigrifluens DSM 30175 = ATCC 13028]QCR03223.1 MFS transporter [Brenneria nigrifluens] [Brenneria nigrifluens DSM 30175 = ATCC 13028]
MYRKHGALLATVCLLCGLEFLQTGMIAFASVPIRGEIDASPEEYSLVAALYACVAVVAIAKQRWLTERLGWRNYMIGSIIVYIAGALLCSLSHNLSTFAIGRVVMALGGASFMTTSRILVNHIPPGPGRFVGIKVFAVGLASGTAAAPLVASLAVTHDTWQAMFWVLIACALVAAGLSMRFLPRDPHPEQERTRTSPARLLLLALGSFFLLYVLQRSYYDFYNDTGIMLVFATLAVFALYTYFHVEHNHQRPLLKIRELMTPRYVLGVGMFSFSYLILGSNNYILPFFLQSGLGYSWETIGKFQALGLTASLLTWLVMMRVLPKYPAPKKFFVLGFLSLAAFGWLLSSLTPVADMWLHILPALALNGCFVMLVLATTAMQTFRDVGHEDALFAHAQQVKNMLGQIAMAAGTSIATIFMQWRSTVQYGAINIRLTQDDPIFTQQLQQLSQFFSLSHEAGQASQMAIAQVAQQISQQASLMAGIEFFWVVIWVAVIAAVLSVLQKVFR